MVDSKHAYLITANGNFQVLNACLRLLDYESNDFFILFDKKSFATIEMVMKNIELPKTASVKYLNVKIINRGGYSQVDAETTLIHEVVISGVNYSYLHFLQNSDLPIKTNADIVKFFETNKGKEFIHIERKSMRWAETCCQYRYFFLIIGFTEPARL